MLKEIAKEDYNELKHHLRFFGMFQAKSKLQMKQILFDMKRILERFYDYKIYEVNERLVDIWYGRIQASIWLSSETNSVVLNSELRVFQDLDMETIDDDDECD